MIIKSVDGEASGRESIILPKYFDLTAFLFALVKERRKTSKNHLRKEILRNNFDTQVHFRLPTYTHFIYSLSNGIKTSSSFKMSKKKVIRLACVYMLC